jgi:uncharacterized protein (TIGR02145 family)
MILKYYTKFSFILIFFSLLLFGCKKDKKEAPPIETGSVTDVNGNTYKTVKIGNQWWMAENLKVTKYRDGSVILQLQSDTTKWKNDTIGGYCVYDANPNAPGLLYNFYAIKNAGNIAPAGWHIPNDDEWKALEKNLGMNDYETNSTSWRGSHEADQLKIASSQGWTTYENIWSTNQTGFTALAGGCRMFNGVWGDPGLFATGFWWSSTTKDNQAWYRYLDYKNSNIFRYYGPKTYGFSVRCVKD